MSRTKRKKKLSTARLLKDGVLTFRQLNECEKAVLAGEENDLYTAAVTRGYAKSEQLDSCLLVRKQTASNPFAKIRPVQLVSAGKITFKQLNEADKVARLSNGERNVHEVLIEKGFITEEDLQALVDKTQKVKKARVKETTRALGLVKSGVISFKQLKEVENLKRIDPTQSLSNLLIERGYANQDEVKELDATATAAFTLPPPKRRRTAKDMVVPDLDEREAKTDPGVSGKKKHKTGLERRYPTAQEFQAARTEVGGGNVSSETAGFGDSGDFQMAQTFIETPAGTEDYPSFGPSPELSHEDFESQPTFMEVDDNGLAVPPTEGDYPDVPTDVDFDDSAQTFIDMEAGSESQSSDSMRTFVDSGTHPGSDSGSGFGNMSGSGSGVLRQTFMDFGDVSSGDHLAHRQAKTPASGVRRRRSRTGSGSGSQAGAGSGSGSGSQSGKRSRSKKNHPLIGEVIGGCQIGKLLGQGGMGAVFKARHLGLKRDVAIKVISPHLASNQQLIQRFIREARSAAELNHKAIVAVHNVGHEKGYHFIEMEYVKGKGLDEYLKEKGPFPIEKAVSIIADAAEGLAEAHARNIVHRDIKPENLMLVDKTKDVKITDFGLARGGSEMQELTKVGQILGTPAYMSPEQCAGEKVDSRSDIYSLGATFYALVTGKMPFIGDSALEIMQKHLDQDPLNPREYNPDIPGSVVSVVYKMMAKRPEDRFQSAKDVCKALERIKREEGKEKIAEIQKQIGEQYKIISKLGQGGMGAVYKATRLSDKEAVAIKVLSMEVTEDEMGRFKREAETAGSIDHPNVVKVLDYDVGGELNYIVMEYVAGTSIRDMIRNEGKLDTREVTAILEETLKGLKAAHDKGIVHRDIKPDNVMVSMESGAIKIADFGLAREIDAQSEVTRAGFILGTPHYMSPEQCKGLEVDHRSDIYSLGVSVYFMLTGQTPFAGDTQMTIMLQHLKTVPPMVHEVCDEVPEGMSNLVANMMAKKAKYRYHTIEEIQKDLQRLRENKKVAKRRRVDEVYDEAGGKKVWIVASLIAVAVLALGAMVGGNMYVDYQARQQEIEDKRLAQEAQQRREDAAIALDKEIGEALAATRSSTKENIEANQFADVIPAFEELLVQYRPTGDTSLAQSENEKVRTRRLEQLQAALNEVKRKEEERDRAAERALENLAASIHNNTVSLMRNDAEQLLVEVKAERQEPSEYDDKNQALANEIREQIGLAEQLVALGDHGLNVDTGEKVLGASEYYDSVVQQLHEVASTQYTEINRRARVAEQKEGFLDEAIEHLQGFVDAESYKDTPAHKRANELLAMKIADEDLNSSAFRNARDLYRDLKNRHDTESGDFDLGSAITFSLELQRFARNVPSDAELFAQKADSLRGGVERDITAMREAVISEILAEVESLVERNQTAAAKQELLKLEDNEDWPAGTTDALEDRLAELELESDKAATEQYNLALKHFNDQHYLLCRSVLDAMLGSDEAANFTKYEAAVDLQEENASFALLHEETTSMVFVNAGTFPMGTDDQNRWLDAHPQHPQETDAYFIDKEEVSILEYQAFLRATINDPARYSDIANDPTPGQHLPANWESIDRPGGKPTDPVTGVRYWDAVAYANWCGKRVPTEQEWEKAAAWGPLCKNPSDKYIFPWGNTFQESKCNCKPGFDGAEVVFPVSSGREGASRYGAVNMAGNVFEWTQGYEGPDGLAYYRAYEGSTNDEKGYNAPEVLRVVRGGSFMLPDYYVQAFETTIRDARSANDYWTDVGFRCVRDAYEKKDGQGK